MKKNRTLLIIILLFGISAIIYLLQIILFHDPKTTLFYFLQDWAFLPITIAVATIVVGKIMDEHEKQNRMNKTRMLASSFFSENGFKLLKYLLSLTIPSSELQNLLKIDHQWTPEQFIKASVLMEHFDFDIHFTPKHLEELKISFSEKRMALLIVTSNPLLFDHENFTDMLWAILHLSDELSIRNDLSHLSETEYLHLKSDIERVLRGLLSNWFLHISYIKNEYPHLYLLAIQQSQALYEKKNI